MINFNDVASQWKEIEDKALPKLVRFLRTGPYILGEQCTAFENEFANYCNAKYAIGVSSGTDGLKLALQCLKREYNLVVVPANGYVADALAPLYHNLDMLLIDCDEYYNLDAELLYETLKDKKQNIIVIAVHLYGQAANIPLIKKLLPDCFIIEDCSQAHGATIEGQQVGTLGDIGVFSLYPTKNLGAIGDAGIITTNIKRFAEHIVSLRNYGKDDYIEMGYNNRLDEIQALILREKLLLLDKWIEKKKYLAKLYLEQLQDIEEIILPANAPYNDGSTYHIFPIRVKNDKRKYLQEHLQKKDVPTLIHYPVPIQKMYLFRNYNDNQNPRTLQYSQELLSLPMHPYLTEEDIKLITTSIKEFFK